MTAPATTGAGRNITWLPAEFFLILVSLVGVLSLQRLFLDDSWRAPLLFSTVVAHLVLIVLRWLRFGVTVSIVGSGLATMAAVTATHYADTAVAALIPTSATVETLQADLNGAQQVFETLQAPVPAVTGLVIVSSVAFWFLAVLADWAAFRLDSPGQALIPALCVAIFISLLGTADNRVRLTAALVLAAALLVLSHRAAARTDHGIWLGGGAGHGYRSLMTVGISVALAGALIGVAAGPRVPGANDAPLVEIGDQQQRQATRPIEVVSPLVQIQPRLIDQSDELLFTVESSEAAYWRIAALDIFDGALWRSEGKFRKTSDGLRSEWPGGIPVTTIDQVFDLSNLDVVWAPAAYLPAEVQTLGETNLNYEADSATFIVDTKQQRVSDGLRYRVVSQLPRFTPEMFAALGDRPATIDPRYLELPENYSPLARSTAEQITAGIPDPFGKATALQNWFRDNFTYDLDVAKGHDIQRLEDFLTVQRGYCEQFAGTFASMARSIGLPSRVATGFTEGEADPSVPGRYLVRGRHAHAWPEVWIEGAGWVAFEPTPGRGMPGAESYTGIPPEQDNGPSDGIDDQADLGSSLALPEPTPTPLPFEPLDLEIPEDQLAVDAASESGISWWPLMLVLGIIVAGLAWVFGIPQLVAWHRRRRRQTLAGDSRRLVTLAWSEAVDRLEDAGHPPRPHETLTEYADRIREQVPRAAGSFSSLTTLAAAAAYGSAPPSADAPAKAFDHAASIIAMLDENQPWLGRSTNTIDPRPVLRTHDPVADRAERLALGATTIVDPPKPSPAIDVMLSPDDD